MINKITSRQNDKIKELVKLYTPSYRNEKKLFLVEGYHLFEMALLSNSIKEVYTLEEIKNIDPIINQYIITDEILEKIAKTKNPQGIVAVCKMNESSDKITNHVLYLDDISDPGNMGTILRTALAFDYKTVILSKNCVSIYNEKVIMSSQGAIFKLNIISDSELIHKLKKDGYQIITTMLQNSVDLRSVNPKAKFVLVMGNESRGVSEQIQNIADIRVRIEMDNIDSLNVGVASGIAMYYLKGKQN